MDKAIFLKLSNYKPLEIELRKPVSNVSKDAISEYISKRSVKAMEEKANAFYADFKMPEVVAEVNKQANRAKAVKFYKPAKRNFY